MHFDCLDEIYAMVMSNRQFDKVALIGLIGLHDRSDQFAQLIKRTLTCANFDRQHKQLAVVLTLNQGTTAHLSLRASKQFLVVILA